MYSATATGSVQYTDSYVYGQSGLPDHFDRQQNGTTSRYWYETDGRGDVVAVTDVNGNVVDSYQYDLWGEPLSYTTREQVPQRLRYAGLWYDTEVEWIWDGSRSYDPEIDRYLQPDGSAARDYVYAGDDPMGAGGGAGGGGGFSSGAGVIGASPSFEGNVECGARPGVSYATPSCGDSGSDIGAPPASGEGGGGTAENSNSAARREPSAAELPKPSWEPGNWQAERPSYTNPWTHDTASRNYVPGKSPVPGDAEDVYKRTSVPRPLQKGNPPRFRYKTWYGINRKGVIYRYDGSNYNGERWLDVHWNGSTSSPRGLKGIPEGVKTYFHRLMEDPTWASYFGHR